MKILLTAPLKQEADIFNAYQAALDRLALPEGAVMDRFYVVNDCPSIIPEIRGEYEICDTGDETIRFADTHNWTGENMAKMSRLRNLTVERMLAGGYDYWFSVDSDVILHPQTLLTLLNADKDIISEIYWTQGWCNAWTHDQYSPAPAEWREPGTYRCGMTGACTLVKRRVFEAGVDYTPIPNIREALRGEDRHFSVRAACAGFELWVDTHWPATHLYTRTMFEEYMQKITEV